MRTVIVSALMHQAGWTPEHTRELLDMVQRIDPLSWYDADTGKRISYLVIQRKSLSRIWIPSDTAMEMAALHRSMEGV